MPPLLKHIAGAFLLCLYIGYAAAQINITRVEYYIDTDPGYGKARQANITSPSPDVTATFPVYVDTLLPGLHIVGIRSQDANGTWSFDERWLVLKQAATTITSNIEKAEWYLDTDPGYGRANNISLSPGQDLVNLSFDSGVSTLMPGLHVIGVRSRNANGSWSFDERWLILKQPATAATTTIEWVEWYVDTDPGYGRAKSIAITPGQDLINLSFDTTISNFSPGLHIIGVRSKDVNGAWSIDERWLVLKPAEPVATTNIERVEWYVDNDPGYGNATAIAITPGTDLVNLSFDSGISTLAPGLHIIGVRSRNTAKAWSFDERWLVLKQATPIVAPNLKRMEYYIDADPGRGNGFPLAFLPGKDVAALPAFVNITGLDARVHKLFIRSQDANNAWSFDDTLSFTISSITPAPFINVNSVAFTNVCAAGTFDMGYHATGMYNSGNQFIAEISDAQGSFASPQTIGSITSISNGGIIQCNLPQSIQGGSGFKMRVRSTNPPLTGNGSDQSLSVSISNFFLGNDTFKIVACAESKVDLTQFYNPANSTLTWTVANPTAAPVGIHSVFAVNSIGCKDTATITVSLPTATWTGAVSSNWHTPGNWSNNAVPADTTHVIIPAETPNECIISLDDAVAASIHVKAGAIVLRILNGRKLLIKAACGTVPD